MKRKSLFLFFVGLVLIGLQQYLSPGQYILDDTARLTDFSWPWPLGFAGLLLLFVGFCYAILASEQQAKQAARRAQQEAQRQHNREQATLAFMTRDVA